MASRRLNDHIRELCGKVINAKDDELEAVLTELKTALHEHTAKLRKLAAKTLIGTLPTTDRRARIAGEPRQLAKHFDLTH